MRNVRRLLPMKKIFSLLMLAWFVTGAVGATNLTGKVAESSGTTASLQDLYLRDSICRFNDSML